MANPRISKALRCRVSLLCLLVLAVGLFFWKEILAAVDPYAAELRFKSSYGRGSSPVIKLHHVDWATLFIGSDGLPNLRRLARDPDITEEGKAKVAKIIAWIESGSAREHFKQMAEMDRQSSRIEASLRASYREYLYEKQAP